MRRYPTRTIMFSFAALVMAMQWLPMPYGENAASAGQADGDSTSISVPASLADELNILRAKVVKLESALAQKHQGESKRMKGSRMNATAPQSGEMPANDSTMSKEKMAGMKKMNAGGKKAGMGKMGGKGMGAMGKDKMSKMRMMGRMPDTGGMSLPSSLPGFPGASHLYHIGGTGFFLDHPEHITLSTEQQTRLGKIKEKTLLADSTLERNIEEAEQQLWVLTSVGEPDIKKIESKLGEIGKLRVDRRLAFIRAVGDAAAVLTDDQRKVLVGEHESDESIPNNDSAQ